MTLTATRTRTVLRGPRLGEEPLIRAMIESVLADYGMPYDQNPDDFELDNLPAAYAHPAECFFVLEDSETGRVLGTSGLKRLSNDLAEIRKMYLRPELRGQGFGRQLMTRMLEHARRAGYRRVTLETNHELAEACRLYDRFGFRKRPITDSRCNCDLRYDLEL